MNNLAYSAAQAYGNVKVESANYADPHQLVGMLMEGVLQRLAKAKSAVLSKQYGDKNLLCGQAIAIITTLRETLDHERGGDISENLAQLYTYMENALLDALVRMDVERLEEVRSLLSEVYGAWQEIPVDVRMEHAS